ncbi:hypothetical protein M5K25_004352 [Dendrobium thyrsiflorum]|uniref:Protein CLT2, chloroplastic n=2 Tax=Magnoliopsida TaxID=3398 RepID=A0ABD0VTZ0_DENTH
MLPLSLDLLCRTDPDRVVGVEPNLSRFDSDSASTSSRVLLCSHTTIPPPFYVSTSSPSFYISTCSPPFSVSTSLAPTSFAADSLLKPCDSSLLTSDPYPSFAPANAFSELALGTPSSAPVSHTIMMPMPDLRPKLVPRPTLSDKSFTGEVPRSLLKCRNLKKRASTPEEINGDEEDGTHEDGKSRSCVTHSQRRRGENSTSAKVANVDLLMIPGVEPKNLRKLEDKEFRGVSQLKKLYDKFYDECSHKMVKFLQSSASVPRNHAESITFKESVDEEVKKERSEPDMKLRQERRYVAVYFSILYVRCSVGIVTKEMLAVPKSRFMAIGLLEALGVACGMSAGAMLPGPAIPILSQALRFPKLGIAFLAGGLLPEPLGTEAFLVCQLVLSVLILRRRYSLNQILGCLLVTAGVILAVASGSSDGQLLSGIEFLWPALMVISSAFQAGASILKEFVFIDGAKRLQGKSLDIFVVNSFGSGFQALFVFLLLPFLSNLRGIPFTQLPQYLKYGAACFLNIGGHMAGKLLNNVLTFRFKHFLLSFLDFKVHVGKYCEGAPFLPLLFILTNMAFNISLLNLVKMSSALLSSLAATLAVPLSIYILSLPLPYIPEGSNLNAFFVIGTAILVSGLALYNLPKSGNQPHRND